MGCEALPVDLQGWKEEETISACPFPPFQTSRELPCTDRLSDKEYPTKRKRALMGSVLTKAGLCHWQVPGCHRSELHTRGCQGPAHRPCCSSALPNIRTQPCHQTPVPCPAAEKEPCREPSDTRARLCSCFVQRLQARAFSEKRWQEIKFCDLHVLSSDGNSGRLFTSPDRRSPGAGPL